MGKSREGMRTVIITVAEAIGTFNDFRNKGGHVHFDMQLD